MNLVALASICLICGLLLWFAYGMAWQAWIDNTEMPLSYDSQGRPIPVDPTPGIYILITLALGAVFSPLSTIASAVISMAYVLSKTPVESICDYSFTGKQALTFVVLSMFFNVLAMVLFNVLVVKSIP